MTEPAPEPVAPAPAGSTWLNIEIDHNSYYRWVPIPEAEADPATTVESTFPGYRMQRIIVDEPTTSTCQVHLPDLDQWNLDRKAAGLSARSAQLNLIQHLSDGPWPKQFPLDSITAIRADDETWAGQLGSAFVAAEPVAAPLPGPADIPPPPEMPEPAPAPEPAAPAEAAPAPAPEATS